MRKSASSRNRLPAIISLSLFTAVWEAAVRLWDIEGYILPSPSAIVMEGTLGFPLMLPHLGISLATALIGFASACILAFLMAIACDGIPLFKQAVYPFLLISQTVPTIFIYPLLMIWFGFGITAKLVVVCIVCFFPMAIGLIDGLASADKELLSLMRSMGAGKLKTLFWVKLPASMPAFFSGIKIAATYSIMGAVIGEWLGAEKGMGVYMMRAYKTFSSERVFAAIVVVIAASLALVKAVQILEKQLITWNSEV